MGTERAQERTALGGGRDDEVFRNDGSMQHATMLRRSRADVQSRVTRPARGPFRDEAAKFLGNSAPVECGGVVESFARHHGGGDVVLMADDVPDDLAILPALARPALTRSGRSRRAVAAVKHGAVASLFLRDATGHLRGCGAPDKTDTPKGWCPVCPVGSPSKMSVLSV